MALGPGQLRPERLQWIGIFRCRRPVHDSLDYTGFQAPAQLNQGRQFPMPWRKPFRPHRFLQAKSLLDQLDTQSFVRARCTEAATSRLVAPAPPRKRIGSSVLLAGSQEQSIKIAW